MSLLKPDSPETGISMYNSRLLILIFMIFTLTKGKLTHRSVELLWKHVKGNIIFVKFQLV